MIKTVFTSNDLEQISGIKAHTIRIWEKRYNLLSPNKASRNIRTYDVNNLHKLLNVALLNKYGYKISKIAAMSEEVIEQTARTLVLTEAQNDKLILDLKLSMYQFDQSMFHDLYHKIVAESSFEQGFEKVFFPFLEFIGMLWQTTAIKPVHEHFISNLIIQKIQQAIAKQPLPAQSKDIYVLFLPENEIHEIGLLYLQYWLLKSGCTTVYLGRDVPMNNLEDILFLSDQLKFVTYFNFFPNPAQIRNYILQFEEMIVDTHHQLIAICHHVESLDQNGFKRTICYSSPKEIL
ncbi:MerR family transcriptional regulator [Membranihabitans marinus]|uniref:MerR family transcriptional regulator n=1 Tax=Membranihabitans marinus TaxID=1227546 RepID=UPI001F0211C0|nr:MerR family transcriptional regulator [Membranihabitans marinus]